MFAHFSINAVKKKSKRRKLKENYPKNESFTTSETLIIPKAEIKVETTSSSSDKLETSNEIRTDNQDVNTSEEPPESEESSLTKSEVVTPPPPERKVTSYVNVSQHFPILKQYLNLLYFTSSFSFNISSMDELSYSLFFKLILKNTRLFG